MCFARCGPRFEGPQTTEEDTMPPTYIAGYDGSEASRAAVRYAIALAEGTGAQVHAVHVHPSVPPVFAPGASSAADAQLREILRQDAERVLDTLDSDDVHGRLVRCDSVAHGLQSAAEDLRAS